MMMEKNSFQLLNESNEKNRNLQTFAKKYLKLSVVLLLIINIIFTIVFGYAAFFRKFADSMNTKNEVEKLHQRVEKDGNLSSQLLKNILEEDKYTILNITRRINALEARENDLKNRVFQIASHKYLHFELYYYTNVTVQKTTLNFSQKLTDFMNMSLQLLKNISDGNKQAMNMTQRIDELETKGNDLKNKFPESSTNSTPVISKATWKFENFASKRREIIGRHGWSKIYYGPSLYTRQFGNKIRLSCKISTQRSLVMELACLKDDCGILLDQPFRANITYFITDETGNWITNMIDIITEKSECAQSTWKISDVDNAYIISRCYFWRGSGVVREDDNAYLGIEVES